MAAAAAQFFQDPTPSSAVTPPRCAGKSATIVRGPGADEIRGTPRADVIFAGAGSDAIHGRGGNDRICAGGGDDRALGETGSDRILLGPGKDEAEGGNGSDRISAEEGRDSVLGNRGNDRLFGGSGREDFLNGGLGDDTVSGGTGASDQVIGDVGNDRLRGGPGGRDLLRGDHGGDYFDGGGGAHDIASFAVSGFAGLFQGGFGLQVDLQAGVASQDGNDQLARIEDVIGSAFNDTITGNGQPNVIYGGGGDDYLVSNGSDDAAFAGPGSDRCEGFEAEDSCAQEPTPNQRSLVADLAGGPQAASLTVIVRYPYAAEQAVTIDVGFSDGAWIVQAGPIPLEAGDRCVLVAAGQARCAVSAKPDAVLLSGSGGDDTMRIGSGVPSYVSAKMAGDYGADTLIGGRGDDDLSGRPSNTSFPLDFVRGRGGDDAVTHGALLDGGAGSDLLIGYSYGGEILDGGPGIDTAQFARAYLSGVRAKIGGRVHNRPLKPHRTARYRHASRRPPSRIRHTVENLEGSPYDDVLIGDNSRNIVLGRGGDDWMLGAGGGDFLVGGTGRDYLLGGSGPDRLYARDGEDDKHIRCAPGSQGREVALVDPFDPRTPGCRQLER